MTKIATQLIESLRHDEYTRNHFDMDQFISSCKTIGCIAGLACMFDEHTEFTLGSDPDLEVFVTGKDLCSISARARELLNLSEINSQHLFLPSLWKEFWLWRFEKCAYGRKKFESQLTSNTAPDLSTIQKMKDFAATWPCNYCEITPDQAANALEGVCYNHIGYVDWCEAVS